MNIAFRMSSIATTMILLTGFSLFKSQEERNNEAMQSSGDPVLAAAFWPSPIEVKGGQFRLKVEKESIHIEHTRFKVVRGSGGWLDQHLASDTSNDAWALRYIETAKARGNQVRMYKAPVNEAIYEMYRPEEPIGSYYQQTRADLDPALIEFNPQGRLVSVLIRVVRLGGSGPTHDTTLVTRLHFGTDKVYIENKLNNRMLEENLFGPR